MLGGIDEAKLEGGALGIVDEAEVGQGVALGYVDRPPVKPLHVVGQVDETQVDPGVLPLVPVDGVDGDPAELMAHPGGAEEDAQLQAGELIHIGEGEHRQIYALHLTGAAIQEGGARPFHLVGGRQVDAGQGDLDRGAGLGGAGEGQRGATEQQGERFHRDSLAV